MPLVNATQFEPSTTPIFSMPQAKPNIHMVFDDSGSMGARDIMMPEHGYSFGQPVCDKQSDEWHRERKARGEYDPFQDGVYKPWDDAKAQNGLIGGKKKPPRMMNCIKVTRAQALDNAYRTVMHKYKEKAYLGMSFLWRTVALDDPNKEPTSLVRLVMDDYSVLSEKDFEEQVIERIGKEIHAPAGGTPMYPAAYEAVKLFRGQPLAAEGANWYVKDSAPAPMISEKCNEKGCYYPYVQFETPLRYRCQENHLIVMTDGVPNTGYAFGMGIGDDIKFVKELDGKLIENGVHISRNVAVNGADIGRLTSRVDLRYASKPIYKNGQWVEKTIDDAGKSWTDELSKSMPITTHSVSLYVDPLDPVYTDMTTATDGMNLGFGMNEGDAEDLVLAFDTIFSSIIKSTSSTMSTNDRSNSEVLDEIPVSSGGVVDLSKVGTIRYDTTYNFNQQMGNIRAMAPYISGYVNVEGEEKPVIDVVELWNTDNTIKSGHGNYITFLDSNDGLKLAHLGDSEVKKQFEAIHRENRYGEKFNEQYIAWLLSGGTYNGGNDLRARLRPMGSVTNSDLVLANKDILNINISKDKMNQSLAQDLVGYLKYKVKNQPVNYLIVSDNDGFVNFVNAQRGLTGYETAGARNTAYFPQLLAHRLAEISGENRPATLVLEGKTKLSDVKVYQQSQGNIYATIGLTSMGSGGKGIVGYRIYGAPEDLKQSSSTEYLDQVTPLFEITNEGPEKYRTSGFKDLGYTYSGFEVFNQIYNGKGRAVATFGNGFGVDKSVLYFIDAYTGEKLHEIILNHDGGGAATPSIVVKASNDGQALDRIYVGDYSGTLYKINFNGKDLDDDSVTVTALFNASTTPNNEGQSAISVKPLVTKSSGLYRVAFGTGNASSYELDRGKNSLVEHNVYNVIDHNNILGSSSATVGLLTKPSTVLSPLLTINDLKVGDVNYAAGSSIDYYSEAKHDLEITMPESNDQDANRNGWAMRLVADGHKSGERTIQNAKYDTAGNNIVFVTWGINERGTGYIAGDLYDPCLSDAAFGKVLSFDAKTGKSSGKKGIYNQGTTGTAEGGLTGEWIEESPEGNDVADLDDFQEGLKDEIIEMIGEEDSSHASNEEADRLDCIGGIFGEVTCEESIPDTAEPLTPGRVNFKKINAYY